MNTVKSSIELIGLTKVARRIGCYPSAVQRWRDNGRLPQTELAGLTNYAAVIAEMSGDAGKPVTVQQLLDDTRSEWTRGEARAG